MDVTVGLEQITKYEKEKLFMRREEQIGQYISIFPTQNTRSAEFDELVSALFNSLEISFIHLQS